MPDTLVIRLDRDPATIQYLLVDATGGRLGAVLTGPLTQAASLAMNRRVVVLIPATEVVCAEPELPAKNAARLAQLAPFALEEQLADDIDSMHFVVGKRSADGKTPVAAVVRERMETWLATLHAAGIQPDAVHSEAAAIPITAGGATLIVDRGAVYVRRAQALGFVLDVQPLDEALRLALTTEGDESEHVLNDLQIYVTQSDYTLRQAELEGMRQIVPAMQLKLLPDGPLPLFALQVANDFAIDFLSGPYERKSSFATSFAPWRYAAVLLGVAAALHFGYSGTQLWQSARAEREVDKQIRELLQTLPGITVKDTRDARKQLESRLNALKQTGGNGDFLGNLATLGEALTQVPDTHIEALSYRMRTIDLRVTAPSVDALDKIEQAATAAGLNAHIQSTTPRDNKIEGRLQLKSGA